jgi:hypothetical protein
VNEKSTPDFILGLFRKKLDTWQIARELHLPEYEVERLLHRALDEERAG